MSEESNEYVADRSEWSRGPWDDEKDDKVVWVDPASGLDCMIVRNHFGTWCGYVGLPPSHPHHGVAYSDLAWWENYEVHGGLTFSGGCSGHICHIPEEGRPHDVWWLGFDCNHLGDLAPRSFGWRSGTYCTQEYVVKEVTQLAAQASTQAAGFSE